LKLSLAINNATKNGKKCFLHTSNFGFFSNVGNENLFEFFTSNQEKDSDLVLDERYWKPIFLLV